MAAARGTEDEAWLAKTLTSQPWHEIGNCPHPLGATDDFDLMVDQLTAVLSARLADLIVYRGSGEYLVDGSGNDESATPPQLSAALYSSLREYVARIGTLYNDVNFHSLQHCVHVTLSMNKLINMLVQPDGTVAGSEVDDASKKSRQRCHTMAHVSLGKSTRSIESSQSEMIDDNNRADEVTFGISSDPLLRFALVFSALIHDVAHQGVPNATLVDEEDELAILHNDVSVAEQNSLQVAFSLLLQEEFQLLKRCITPDKESRKIFRKKVIDVVLVSDISNPERMQIVESRWKEAFAPPDIIGTDVVTDQRENLQDSLSSVFQRRPSNEFREAVGRRRFSMYTGRESLRNLQLARLGIRHALQLNGKMIDVYDSSQLRLRQHAVMDAMMHVADVAHTMQGFPVFVKWNRQLYKELFHAYHAGRLEGDPTPGWYRNQLNFYDAYIIPLAGKLDQCGIFGSQSSVFLYFATENKRKWAAEGAKITKEMIDSVARESITECKANSANDSDSLEEGLEEEKKVHPDR